MATSSKKSKRAVAKKKSSGNSSRKAGAKKTAKKSAAKKPATRKVVPSKKSAGKSAQRAGAKKSAPNKAGLKRSAKKAVKKVAPKKTAKKAAKKVAPKKAAKNSVASRSIPAKKKSVAKKSQPAKKASSKKPPRLSPQTGKDRDKKDVKDTLRNLTEESVAKEPVGHEEEDGQVAQRDDKKINYTNSEEAEEKGEEPTPWVDVDDHVAVEDTAISGKEEITEDSNADEIVNPTEKPFEKFTPKPEPHQKLYLSNKPKGVVKPSGKKPLWN